MDILLKWLFNATNSGRRLLLQLKKDKEFNHSLFPIQLDRFSYSITLALRDIDATDIAYKAIQTLTKSTEYYIEKFNDKEKISFGQKQVLYYFPIIALDCPLFEMELLKNGETELKEVKQTKYLARNPRDNNFLSLIDVITKPVIREYAKSCSMAAEKFISDYKVQIQEFIKTDSIW